MHFFAPLNEDAPSEEIEYDVESYPSDADLIRSGDYQGYAYKQCLKMCEYISKIRGHEILQMKAEFVRDENGWIWFFYARDVFMRKNKNRTGLSNVDAKKKAD